MADYVEKYQHKLEAYTTSAMIYNQKINTIVSSLNKELVNIPTAYSAMRYIAEPLEHVIDFSSYLEECGIPFFYISTPSYESILCREGELQLQDNCNSERSWFMLKNLNEADVSTLDLAKELSTINLKSYDISGHWFPICALYSAEMVSEVLNQYGFSFDPSFFYEINSRDYFEDKEEWKAEIYTNCGYQYSFPIPIGTRGMTFRLEHEGLVREGAFEDVFLQPPDKFTTSPYHGFSVVSNSTLYRYYNENTHNNKGKKLLLIGDSFNWILADYLAIDIERIDVIHNASYVPSIRDYIMETVPDMVLMIYSDAEFSEVYTEQAFYLD